MSPLFCVRQKGCIALKDHVHKRDAVCSRLVAQIASTTFFVFSILAGPLAQVTRKQLVLKPVGVRAAPANSTALAANPRLSED